MKVSGLPCFRNALLPATLVALLWFAGCGYSSPLQGVSCDESTPCRAGAECFDGYCVFLQDGDGVGDGNGDGVGDGNGVGDGDGNGVGDGDGNGVGDGDGVGDGNGDELSCTEEQYLCDETCQEAFTIQNCLDCNDSCSAPTNASPFCDVLSGCDFTCNAGFQICDDSCWEESLFLDDNENCGACNNSCTEGFFCDAGSCEPDPCDPTTTPFGGGDGSNDDPFALCSPAHLDNIRTNRGASYQLFSDIDLAGFSNFVPIGSGSNRFEGRLNGNGFTITNLTIDRSDNEVGLFGSIGSSGVILNLNFSNASVKGAELTAVLSGGLFGLVDNVHVSSSSIEGTDRVGGLIGATGGTDNQILNSTADVTVLGTRRVGGIVGRSNGVLLNITTTGTVTGQAFVGGVVGALWQNSGVGPSGTIEDSTSSAAITITGLGTNDFDAGGLVGFLGNSSTVKNSSASGTVTGNVPGIGGLVGFAGGNTSISRSFATGAVSGVNQVGGLLGFMQTDAQVTDSFATGPVSGNNSVGGLVGRILNNGTVTTSHSTGTVTTAATQAVDSNFGGLVGHVSNGADADNTINSFWNTDTSAQSTSAGGTGLNSTQYVDESNFTGFNFQTIWEFLPGAAYPTLQTP